MKVLTLKLVNSVAFKKKKSFVNSKSKLLNVLIPKIKIN